MKTQAAALALLISTSVLAAEVEPLHVDINVRGRSYMQDKCEGGNWSFQWQGELPAEGRNLDNLLISYNAFDTTLEDEREDPPATFHYDPLTCRDRDGKIVLRATMTGGQPTIRGTLALKDNAGVHSPFFNFDVDHVGACERDAGGVKLFLQDVTAAVRTQTMTTIEPALAITRKDLEDGFSKTYRLGGFAIANDGMACLGTQLEGGEVTLSYKRKAEKPAVQLSGCVQLARGTSADVQAKTSPQGGKLTITSQPGTTLAVATHGSSATVTGATPGRATLTATYALKGQTATASLSGSSIELVSVNGGAPLPRLGLYGIDGKPISKVYTFPFVANPSDAGDLLIFKAENSSLASVVTGRSSLSIQPVKEGTTVVQAKTACGASLGSPFEVEVVPCDDEVHDELKRRKEEAAKREREMVKRITQLTADPEFQRASTEIKQSTQDLAVKTGELIIGALTAGESAAGKAGVEGAALNAEQLKNLNTIYSGYKMVRDGANGQWDKVMVDAFVKAFGNWAVSIAKTTYRAEEAAGKFGRDLGTIMGVLDQLEELEPQHDKIRRELYTISDRLNRCEKLPPPTPLPPPPPKPRTPPAKRPGSTPVPVPTEPGSVDVPPPATNTPPPTPPGPIDPPLPASGSVGLCVRANQQYVETLKSAQSVFSGISSAVATLDAANQSGAADRQAVLENFAPRYDAFVEQFYKVSEATRAQAQQFQPCTDALPEWVRQIHTKY